MKRIISLVIATAVLVLPATGQENVERLKKLENLEEQAARTALPDTLVMEEENITIADEDAAADDTSVLKIGDNVLVFEETGDETIIRINKRGERFYEDDENRDMWDEDFSDRHFRSSRHDKFGGHLSGVEFGYNGYLTDFWSTSLEAEDSFLNLKSSKSTAFNIIFPGVNLGITRRVGFVAALGLNFNNYRFDGNNTISVDAGGIIMPMYPPLTVSYEKSKLATLYAILPVILEGQIPLSHGSSVNIGAGIIGAVKLGSHTKVVYFEDGKQKVKNRDDFSLNLLRYGVTARLGYEMVQVYGTCYLSPMFEEGKAPELYPFEVGIALTFND